MFSRRWSFWRRILASSRAKISGWKGCWYLSRCQRMRARWTRSLPLARPCGPSARPNSFRGFPSRSSMRHGGDGLGCAQSDLPSPVEFAKVVLGLPQGLGRQPQRFGHAALHVARAHAVNLPARDPVVGTEPQPLRAPTVCSVCLCSFAPCRLCVSFFTAKTPRREGAERIGRMLEAGFDFWVRTCLNAGNRRHGRGMFGKGMSSIPLTIIVLTIRWFGR